MIRTDGSWVICPNKINTAAHLFAGEETQTRQAKNPDVNYARNGRFLPLFNYTKKDYVGVRASISNLHRGENEISLLIMPL